MSFTLAAAAGAQPLVDHGPRSYARRGTVAAATAWAGVCALIVVAPFEALQPLIRLPGQSLSTVETALIAALGAWGISFAASRQVPQWRTPLTLPWAALIAAMAVAALAAPEHRANAVNMVGRLTLAFAVYVMTVNGVTSGARLRGTFVAAAIAGAIVWPLIVLEYAGVRSVTEALSAFRLHAANVGAQVRAAGPFQYPTIASMYLEILFALASGLLLAWIDGRKVGRALAVGVVLVAIGHAILLTFTRAGLITFVSTFAIVGAVRFRRRHGFDAGVGALAAVGALVAIQVADARSFETLGLRLTTEGQNSWYRASFDVPLDVAIPAGGVVSIPIKVTNTGRGAWDSSSAPPFRLSYHWLLEDNRVISWQGLRTDFPAPVRPGETVSLDARVDAPMKPGTYRLMWDIERENWLWFSTEPGAVLFVSRATVTGPDVGPLGWQMSLPSATPRPGRLALWRAAVRIFVEHPLTGVGPDNYRLMYGPYAGLANFDQRVHTNNMYLEMLVGGGLLGGLAFAWLCWAAFKETWTAVRSTVNTEMFMAAAGVAAAVVAIAIHGLMDSFVSFTATYILIAITLGLASACAANSRSHARRV
jgi:hypothetical protein